MTDEQANGTPPAWWFLDTLVVELPTTTGGGLTVLEMTLPVGAAPPAHIHHGYDDSFYLVEGELVVSVGDSTRRIGPGSWVSVPAGTRHAFRVVGDRPARFVSVFSTSSFIELIREIGVAAETRTIPQAGLAPAPDVIMQGFAAHDVEVVGGSLEEDEARAVVAAPA